MWKGSVLCAGLIAILGIAGPVLAADHEAGVPLTPAEAVGGWTLSTQGRAVCMIRLGARHTVRTNGDCSGALSAQPIGWAPTQDGMRLTGPGGQTVMAFDRWSNSLFVSEKGSATDAQLRRGD
ncbi:MAG TPA: AprI/Inh family metalloprotease inhibitor [Caulobacteraceae bacterium]